VLCLCLSAYREDKSCEFLNFKTIIRQHVHVPFCVRGMMLDEASKLHFVTYLFLRKPLKSIIIRENEKKFTREEKL